MSVLEKLNYKITYNPISYDYSETVLKTIEEMYYVAQKGKAVGLKQLERAIKKYPKIPTLHQYLSIWYRVNGKLEKSREVNEKLYKLFPDYLHGKVMVANHYLNEGEYDKVLEIFDKGFDLKNIYPARDVFHFSEQKAVSSLAFEYFLEKGEEEQYQYHYEILKEILEEEEMFFYDMLLQIKMNNMEGAGVRKGKEEPVTTEEEKPKFNHEKEMSYLYQETFVSEQEIDAILALPRETLIQDLETALKDTRRRYSYLKETDSAPYLAIAATSLLKDLKSEASLSVVLDIASEGEDFIEYWFDDFITEGFWHIIYELGKNSIDTLFRFLRQEDLYTFSISAISNAIFYKAFENPDVKTEILKEYHALLEFYYAQSDEVQDTNRNAVIISDVSNLHGKESLELIKAFYDREIVDETYIDYDDVIYEMNLEKIEHHLEKLSHTKELLDWYGE